MMNHSDKSEDDPGVEPLDTPPTPSQKITTTEMTMIALNAVYLTYPLGVTVLFFLFPRPSGSSNPLAGIEHIQTYIVLITAYTLLATVAGLTALILDIIYLRKFRPAGKRKQLIIVSIASISMCALLVNFIVPVVRQ